MGRVPTLRSVKMACYGHFRLIFLDRIRANVDFKIIKHLPKLLLLCMHVCLCVCSCLFVVLPFTLIDVTENNMINKGNDKGYCWLKKKNHKNK